MQIGGHIPQALGKHGVIIGGGLAEYGLFWDDGMNKTVELNCKYLKRPTARPLIND